MVLLKPKEEKLYFFKHDTGSRLFRDNAFPGGAGVKPNPSPLVVCVMSLALTYCCSCISNSLAEHLTLLGVSDVGVAALLPLLIPINQGNFSFALSLPKFNGLNGTFKA